MRLSKKTIMGIIAAVAVISIVVAAVVWPNDRPNVDDPNTNDLNTDDPNCPDNEIIFTEEGNIIVDQSVGSTWGQPVYDGENIVVSAETKWNISVQKYDLSLNPVGVPHEIANLTDTGGEYIADHKHLFQNGCHFLVFSISGTGAGGDMYLVKFDEDFNRIGITQVIDNDVPTNDMLIIGDGTDVFVGKFNPGGGMCWRILQYDEDLNWMANYSEGIGEYGHANGGSALYIDGQFVFVSPQYVGPGANSRYYVTVYDDDFQPVQARKEILYEESKLALVNGFSTYNGEFIIHYCYGSNEANPINRAVYDCEWNLIQNETVYEGDNHAPHTVVVGDDLYMAYTNETSYFKNGLSKFSMTIQSD